MYVTEVAKFKGQVTDQDDYMPPEIFAEKAALIAGVIATLGAETAAIDARMSEICSSSDQLALQMKLPAPIP
jgi:hypothetical protein